MSKKIKPNIQLTGIGFICGLCDMVVQVKTMRQLRMAQERHICRIKK